MKDGGEGTEGKTVEGGTRRKMDRRDWNARKTGRGVFFFVVALSRGYRDAATHPSLSVFDASVSSLLEFGRLRLMVYDKYDTFIYICYMEIAGMIQEVNAC